MDVPIYFQACRGGRARTSIHRRLFLIIPVIIPAIPGPWGTIVLIFPLIVPEYCFDYS